MQLEVWVRPSRGVRQAVIRITLRRDGRAFVQARAGLGCCAPQIDRRVDIDTELPAEQIPGLKAISGDALVVLVDGSTHVIPREARPEAVKAALTAAVGENESSPFVE